MGRCSTAEHWRADDGVRSHRTPYAALAPIYDLITAGHDYERWIDAVLELYELLTGDLGSGLKVLDIGCGTGRGMAALVARGHRVSGVDISAEMLAIAAERLSCIEPTPMLICQDMRQLDMGQERFQLALGLCGSFNYLRSVSELTTTLDNIASCLVAGGVLVFDITTERKLASAYGLNPCVEEGPDYVLAWDKVWQPRKRLWHFRIDVFTCSSRQMGTRWLWARNTEVHSQHAFSPAEVVDALRVSGFERVVGPLAAFSLEAADSGTERVFYAAQVM
jgi:SAM-dependent methyltransferase